MADEILSDRDLDTLFRQARTYYSWADTPVTHVRMQAIYDLARMGPTSANASPARFVWCESAEAKERLGACVS